MITFNEYELFRYLFRTQIGNNVPIKVRQKVPLSTQNWFHYWVADMQDQQRWFIKQPIDQFPPEYGLLPVSEAKALSYLCKDSALAPFLPKVIHFEELHQLIILEYLPEDGVLPTATLQNPRINLKAESFIKSVAKLMKVVHQKCLKQNLLDEGVFIANDFSNNYIRAYEIVENFLRLSAKDSLQIYLQNQLKEKKIQDAIIEIENSWQRSHLIHGDAFLRNFYAYPERLVWLDWNSASWGDPRWDIANFFGDYFHCLLYTHWINEKSIRHLLGLFAQYYEIPAHEVAEWQQQIIQLCAYIKLKMVIREFVQTPPAKITGEQLDQVLWLLSDPAYLFTY